MAGETHAGAVGFALALAEFHSPASNESVA
jgi:hypothetical protein